MPRISRGLRSWLQIPLDVLAIDAIARLDLVIAFIAALDGHLALFALFAELGDLVFELQIAFVALGVELSGLRRRADGAASVGAVFAVVKIALPS